MRRTLGGAALDPALTAGVIAMNAAVLATGVVCFMGPTPLQTGDDSGVLATSGAGERGGFGDAASRFLPDHASGRILPKQAAAVPRPGWRRGTRLPPGTDEAVPRLLMLRPLSSGQWLRAKKTLRWPEVYRSSIPDGDFTPECAPPGPAAHRAWYEERDVIGVARHRRTQTVVISDILAGTVSGVYR